MGKNDLFSDRFRDRMETRLNRVKTDRRIWDSCENMPGLDLNDLKFLEEFTRVLSESEFYGETFIDQKSFFNLWARFCGGFVVRLERFLDHTIEKIPNVLKTEFVSVPDEQWWNWFTRNYVREDVIRIIDDIIALFL